MLIDIEIDWSITVTAIKLEAGTFLAWDFSLEKRKDALLSTNDYFFVEVVSIYRTEATLSIGFGFDTVRNNMRVQTTIFTLTGGRKPDGNRLLTANVIGI